MALAYTANLPHPSEVPEHLHVRVFVTRPDGRDLSAEDLETLARVYPPASADARAAVETSIARAKRRVTKSSSTKTTKATARPGSKATKRKAAKRPVRER